MNEILSDAKRIIQDAIQASLPDEAVKKAIGGKAFDFQGKVFVISRKHSASN